LLGWAPENYVSHVDTNLACGNFMKAFRRYANEKQPSAVFPEISLIASSPPKLCENWTRGDPGFAGAFVNNNNCS
jgi:hypothetical protein